MPKTPPFWYFARRPQGDTDNSNAERMRVAPGGLTQAAPADGYQVGHAICDEENAVWSYSWDWTPAEAADVTVGAANAAAATHVVAAMGQSNQRGAAPNDGGASYPANMLVFNGTAVVTPSGGLPHIGGTGAGEPSIAIEFARQYLAANPGVTLIVVPCAQDGTGFASNDWNPGNSL